MTYGRVNVARPDVSTPLVAELYKAAREIGVSKPLFVFDSHAFSKLGLSKRAISQYIARTVSDVLDSDKESLPQSSVTPTIWDLFSQKKNMSAEVIRNAEDLSSCVANGNYVCGSYKEYTAIVLGQFKKSNPLYSSKLAPFHELGHAVQDIILGRIKGRPIIKGGAGLYDLLPRDLTVDLNKKAIKHIQKYQWHEFSSDVLALINGARKGHMEACEDFVQERGGFLLSGSRDVKKLISQYKYEQVRKTFAVLRNANLVGLENSLDLLKSIEQKDWKSVRTELKEGFKLLKEDQTDHYIERLEKGGLKSFSYNECSYLCSAIVARNALSPNEVTDTYNEFLSMCGVREKPQGTTVQSKLYLKTFRNVVSKARVYLKVKERPVMASRGISGPSNL